MIVEHRSNSRKTPAIGPIVVVSPPDANTLALAALARRLITENDPDAIRAGLAEIANALDNAAPR